MNGAGVALAGVVASEPAERVRYGLVYARDQAVYAAVNGLVLSGVAVSQGDAAGGVERAGYRIPVPVPTGPLPPVAVPGSPENIQNGKDWVAFWRWLLDQRPEMADPSDMPELWLSDRWAGMPMVSPMRIPNDAKDPKGAKAPGKPTKAEGFEDPKGGEEWVREPNGSRYGWKAKDGSVWVPTGFRDIAHGGPHWDVQHPDGSYSNVFPPMG